MKNQHNFKQKKQQTIDTNMIQTRLSKNDVQIDVHVDIV